MLPVGSPVVEADLVDLSSPLVKTDVLRLVQQYLEDEGYMATALTLQDETNLRRQERSNVRALAKKLRKAIIDGDWTEVEKLCGKSAIKSHKSFLFRIFRHQFLELIEKQETQKAFSFLSKRLKPLESWQSSPDEMKELCYLLSCRSVSLPGWPGVAAGREKLAEEVESVLMGEVGDASHQLLDEDAALVPEGRLLKLLQQAVAYQIQRSRHKPSSKPHVETLMKDYECFAIPNTPHCSFKGHLANVLSVCFVGDSGSFLASGSSDNTVRLWDVNEGDAILRRTLSSSVDDVANVVSIAGCGETVEEAVVLQGHTSRIWSLDSNRAGTALLSASGDGTVRLWNVADITSRALPGTDRFRDSPTITESRVVTQHNRDAFAVTFHPGEDHGISGGLDRMIHQFDLHVDRNVKSFEGHRGGVTSVKCTLVGSLVASGSKDSTVRLWDVLSGISIAKMQGHLGEVTSVDFSSDGLYVLSASKDNTVALWDIRKGEILRKFKGYHNTSKNLIRCSFGPAEKTVISGSEDGIVYIWDLETTEVIGRLRGHQDIVYAAAWNPSRGLLATCSHDREVKTWCAQDLDP